MDFGKFFSRSLILLFKKIRNTQMSNMYFSAKYLDIKKWPGGLVMFQRVFHFCKQWFCKENNRRQWKITQSTDIWMSSPAWLWKTHRNTGECFSCITFHRLCVPRVCPNPFNPPPRSRIIRSTAAWWPNPNLGVELFSSSNTAHKYLSNRMVRLPIQTLFWAIVGAI